MKYFAVLLFLFVSISAFAQEQTLLGVEDVEHGGYGAFVIKFTNLNDEFAVVVGARGGWIINHTFAIGFAGYGVTNNVHSMTIGPLDQRFMNLGYGGLDLELILNSDGLAHFSVHSLIGAGGVGFRGGWDDDWMGERDDETSHHDGFFILEPGVNVDLNVMPWFRFSAGASYRYVSGVSSGASNNGYLKGPSAILTFRFGKF